MKGNVLIVDDDKAMGELLDFDLKRRGFHVTWHRTAEEASAALKEADFDVVLADIYLPGMTGIELCERISANRPDIPVIAITGFGSLEKAIEFIHRRFRPIKVVIFSSDLTTPVNCFHGRNRTPLHFTRFKDRRRQPHSRGAGVETGPQNALQETSALRR